MAIPPIRLVIVIAAASDHGRRLVAIFAREEGVQVAALCSDAMATRSAVARHRPDILFFEAPALGGVATAHDLSHEGSASLVLLSNDSREAVAAFTVGAIDCLALPVTRERIQETLMRARVSLPAARVAQQVLATANECLDEVRRRPF
jgi:DNA-binding LytR/AlgR family response regulator